MSVYEYTAKTIKGEEISLKNYEGKVILIVNTASECGYTPQYKQLQELHETYSEQGLVVLGFPCNQFGEQEPGEESDIERFCELNYGVTFQMFTKVDVNGEHVHPLFTYLKQEAPSESGAEDIEWNFTKFLIDKSGKRISRYSPKTNPLEMKNEIEQLLG
ncbi:glutathione peroxidase [Chengkuizengella axinellae]|uniref:Glutathione peroxidase n=1 Tax=Chengkuizengella axinellae TaxID=3064388 RepID=A0ABT9J1C1_9BACL|nr:glutathione peroxidase [Chengkuizengella sp. 2205SS18-9]MDP5275410.1 glutathione peroxidase [Chengkuizengella sp. 2205SS18-9]